MAVVWEFFGEVEGAKGDSCLDADQVLPFAAQISRLSESTPFPLRAKCTKAVVQLPMGANSDAEFEISRCRRCRRLVCRCALARVLSRAALPTLPQQ